MCNASNLLINMKDKKTIDTAAVHEMGHWLCSTASSGSVSESLFQKTFGDQYDFAGISNKTRREIIDLCTTDDALFAVLRWLLRPHHFGDIQSGESYLDHVLRLESVRSLAPSQQFWIHRVALQFVLSGNVTSYAHRSLPEVVSFSTKTNETLDALLDRELWSIFENIALAALDKWYMQHPNYLSVRTLYQESWMIRRVMNELDNDSRAGSAAVLLPHDLY